MTEAVNFTIMLSFNVLIGLHKVPELLLALLCQKLTGKKGMNMAVSYAVCIFMLSVNLKTYIWMFNEHFLCSSDYRISTCNL